MDPMLARVIEALVHAVHPVRIILFGSRAREDAREDSDIDLLLQVDTGRDSREVAKESYKAIHRLKERPLVGIDIVVKDSAYVERYGNLVGTVVRPALREGRVLYVR